MAGEEQKTLFSPEETIFRKQTEVASQEDLTRVLSEDAFKYDRETVMQSNRSSVLKAFEDTMTIRVSKHAEIDRFSVSFRSETSESKRNVKKHLKGSAIHAKQKNAGIIEEEEKKAGAQYTERMFKALDYAAEAGYEDKSSAHVLMRDLSCFFLEGEKNTEANKKLITDAVNRDTAVQALETCKIRFLEMPMDNIDLRSDESFAKESARLEEISQKTLAIKRLLGSNPDFLDGLSQPEKEMLSAKIEKCDKLIPYYRAKKAVIKNPYYSSHYNSELTSFKSSNQTPEQREVGDLIRNLGLAEYVFKNEDTLEEKARYLADRHFEEGNEAWDQRIYVFRGVNYTHLQEGGKIGSFNANLMRLVSWIMRKKRSADHGASRYDESVEKMKKLPEKALSIAEGKPVTWRRGNAPNILLSKYFQDPHKMRLRSLLGDAPQDDQDAEYKKAQEALTHYVDIAGIVNRDTTEMEMAFLDTFLKTQKAWLEKHGDDASPETAAKKAFLQEAAQKITTLGGGSLGEDMDAEEFRYLAERSEVITEDTKILPNMEESNIRDIPLFLHTPNINDIKQSTIGDCWLMSAITTLVATAPDFITHMMKDLGDGTVLVRLYTSEPASITAMINGQPTRIPQDIYKPRYFRIRKDYEEGNGNADDCVWVQLIEKAFAAAGFAANRRMTMEGGTMHNMAGELTEGDADKAMMHMLGREIYSHSPQTYENSSNVIYSDVVKDDQKAVMRELLSGLPKHLQDMITAKMQGCGDRICYTVFMETLEESFAEDQQLFAPQLDEISGLLEHKVNQAGKDAIMTRLNTITSTEADLEKYKARLKKNFGDLSEGRSVLHNGTELTKFSDEMLRKLLGEIIVKLNSDDSSGDLLVGEINQMTEEIFRQAGIDESSPKELRDTLDGADFDLYGVRSINNPVGLRKYQDEKKLASDRAKEYAHHFLYENNGKYDQYQIDFLATCKEATDAGGAVSLGTPGHFMNVVDTAYKDGTWYLLVRDPFNTYNREYGEAKTPGGEEPVSSEGFGSVLLLHKEHVKRNLSDDEETSVLGGFRGLSWWKLEDVYQKDSKKRQFEQCFTLTPEVISKGPKTKPVVPGSSAQGGGQ